MKIVDLGTSFGLQTARIFRPWVDEGKAQVITPPHMWPKIKEVLKGDIDLVSFGGGADIHPSLYGHRNVASHVGNQPSYRDICERAAFEFCEENGIPMLGICRGAQLLCALSGGALIQDVSGHAGWDHDIVDNEGRSVMMTTAHHQMMYVPEKLPHELIAWSKKLSKHYAFDTERLQDFKVPEVEPEIVYFKTSNALAIQGHPEFISNPMHETVEYTRELISKYLLNKEECQC